MPAKTHKPSKMLLYLASLILLAAAFACFMFWLFMGVLTPAKIKILNFSRLPIAKINNHFLPFNEFWKRWQFSQNYFFSQAKTSFAPSRQDVLNSYIKESEINDLASRLAITINAEELNNQLSQISSQGNLNTQNIYADFLKNNILKPKLQLLEMQIWFNAQSKLNTQAYGQMAELQQRLNKGDKFENLAQDFSQDSATKKLGGSLGFTAESDILPELSRQIKQMRSGEIRLIPSRYGLHLIKLLGARNGNNNQMEYNLQQIFVKTSDFNLWLQNQLAQFTVKQYINLSQ